MQPDITTTVLAPDGETFLTVEYHTEPAEPDVGICRESVVITDVLLEDCQQSVLDEYEGDEEFIDHVTQYVRDYGVEYPPHLDPDYLHDKGAENRSEKEYA